jgi:hypothetical protein
LSVIPNATLQQSGGAADVVVRVRTEIPLGPPPWVACIQTFGDNVTRAEAATTINARRDAVW